MTEEQEVLPANAKNQQLIDQLCLEHRKRLERIYNTENAPAKPESSPILLSINAMIAEHLFQQQCHQTLVAFISEVQCPETLPTFDQSSSKCFTEADVKDVLEVMEVVPCTEVSKDVFEEYSKGGKSSLLATILRTFGDEKLAKDTRKDLSLFNKYLKVLMKRIARITYILNELRQKRAQMKCYSPARKREGKQIRDLVKVIEKLNRRLSTSVTKIRDNSHFKATKQPTEKDKTYKEWIKDLKDSKQGRKLIRRIEKVLFKALTKERELCKKGYEEKLENQKLILKLHYKQKFLEHYQAWNLPPQDHLKDQEQLKNQERQFLKKMEQQFLKKPEKLPEKTQEPETKVSKDIPAIVYSINNKPTRLIDIKSVEDMIKNAKSRLEVGSEKLDKSFTNYLEKQINDKKLMKRSVSEIWNTYNHDRSILQQRKHEANARRKIDALESIAPDMQKENEDLNLSFPSKGSSKSSEFYNPFINFNVKRYLESTHKPELSSKLDKKIFM